jgi:hypothetical protein
MPPRDFSARRDDTLVGVAHDCAAQADAAQADAARADAAHGAAQAGVVPEDIPVLIIQ